MCVAARGGSKSPAVAAAAWTIPTNDQIRNVLAERMRHNGVGTVVGVIEPSGRRVVVFGRSGAANGRALDGDTVFQIGSVSKVFVGLLLADMVVRGEVALDDPAQKYLPAGVKMPQRGRPITLLDLSTHRSGLPSMPDNFRIKADPNPVEAYAVDDLWQFLSHYQLTREPGERYEYSNLAVSLLGRLLAQRAGKDYETLLKERVLEPLGMHSSAITPSPAMNAYLAPGHDRYLQPVYVWEMKTLAGLGSLRSTANDMLGFVGAYLGEPRTRLADSMALQLRTRFPENGTAALGWAVRKDWRARDLRSRGRQQDIALRRRSIPARVLASWCCKTRARMTGPPRASPAHRPRVGARARSAGGRSESSSSHRRSWTVTQVAIAPRTASYRVLHKRDHLLVSYRAGDEGLEFLAVSQREFFYSPGNDEIEFEVDEGGVVTGMRIYSDGKVAGTFDRASRVD